MNRLRESYGEEFMYRLMIIWLAVLLPVVSAEAAGRDTVSVVGTGDIVLGMNYPEGKHRLPKADGDSLFFAVSGFLQDADLTTGNLEGVFLNRGDARKTCKDTSVCFLFRMPEHYVKHLATAGFDIMSVANNHIGDFGSDGIRTTLRLLKEAGIRSAGIKGVCEAAVLERRGVKFGFCAFAPNNGMVSILDSIRAQQVIRALDSICDVVVVSFHGGAEGIDQNRVPRVEEFYQGENRGNVYRFAHACIDAGADIVFGHGPHVVRGLELYKDRFIAYSLGNFCTPYGMSKRGRFGYAPAVRVMTDRQGNFLRGVIFSAVQDRNDGPVPDTARLAIKEMARLTKLDFPATPLHITDDGTILRTAPLAADSSDVLPDWDDNLLLEEEFGLNDSLTFLVLNPRLYPLKTKVDTIISMAKSYLGTPYGRGYKGPSRFDCSGFTNFIYSKFGYRLDLSASGQYPQGIYVNKENLQKGDLVFFEGRRVGSKRVGHVGIVVEVRDKGKSFDFIHACSRGVIIDNYPAMTYYSIRYIGACRVVPK